MISDKTKVGRSNATNPHRNSELKKKFEKGKQKLFCCRHGIFIASGRFHYPSLDTECNKLAHPKRKSRRKKKKKKKLKQV